MNEALIEEIKTAYEKLGIAPIRRCYYLHEEGGDSACPLVALALFHGVVEKDDPGIELDDGLNVCLEWGSNFLGEDFTWGLMSAWDGHEKIKDDPDYLRGYTLGLAAAQQLSPRDPPV